MRDEDMAGGGIMYASNPYDAHGIYDDPGAGPSRAAPLPYDDPYSDGFGIDAPAFMPAPVPAPDVSTGPAERMRPVSDGRMRGRGRGGERGGPRGRGRGGDRGGPRGRGRGGDRGRAQDRGRGRGNFGGGPRPGPPISAPSTPTTPTGAIGQFDGGQSLPQQAHQPFAPGPYQQQQMQPAPMAFGGMGAGMGMGMGMGAGMSSGMGMPMGFVQPHINPRFAAQLGLNMAWMQPMQQQQHQQFMPFQFGAGGPSQQQFGPGSPSQQHQAWNGGGQGFGHDQQQPPPPPLPPPDNGGT
jgi:H/ACA ribonucleoprotein complex non-core subunit NAF1